MTTPNPGFAHPDAACHGTDPDLFFPEHASSEIAIAQAVNICQQCPEPCRTACLDHALTWREAGIWGGTTGRQRKTMRTNRNKEIPVHQRPPGCAERCLAELHANPGQWTTTLELHRRTGYSTATINTTMGRLHHAGIIRRDNAGPGRSGYWSVPAQVETTVEVTV